MITCRQKKQENTTYHIPHDDDLFIMISIYVHVYSYCIFAVVVIVVLCQNKSEIRIFKYTNKTQYRANTIQYTSNAQSIYHSISVKIQNP